MWGSDPSWTDSWPSNLPFREKGATVQQLSHGHQGKVPEALWDSPGDEEGSPTETSSQDSNAQTKLVFFVVHLFGEFIVPDTVWWVVSM